ncbi:hypothetical protein C4546_04615 [Candidatus Parcubacteria bacterium]|jgi:hypothetical protein|nr:MAG: hypothetical protein C4546_04615 [Candidatus Parcubacteria bacterium]
MEVKEIQKGMRLSFKTMQDGVVHIGTVNNVYQEDIDTVVSFGDENFSGNLLEIYLRASITVWMARFNKVEWGEVRELKIVL